MIRSEPSFTAHAPSFMRKVFRKVLDAEGRVLEPLECGQGRMCFISARPGGSLTRLHRPNLLGLDCMGFKDKNRFPRSCGLQPCLPQRGPYEASSGIHSGHGQTESWGWASFQSLLPMQHPRVIKANEKLNGV